MQIVSLQSVTITKHLPPLPLQRQTFFFFSSKAWTKLWNSCDFLCQSDHFPTFTAVSSAKRVFCCLKTHIVAIFQGWFLSLRPGRQSQCYTTDKFIEHLYYTRLDWALKKTDFNKTHMAPTLTSLTNEQEKQTLNMSSPN